MSSFFTSFRPHLRTPLKASTMNPYAIAGAAGLSAGAYGLYSRSVRLDSAEPVNHNTKRLRFALPDPTQSTGLTLTSAVLTISWPKDSWTPVVRPYTPVNDLNEPGFVELLVKHYPGGKQSTHLHSMKPGDTIIMLRGIPPGYKWKTGPSSGADKPAHVALIAGGAGITPVYQLARGILADDADDRTRITLVWGVNTDEDIFLADELAELERRHPGRLRTQYVVSRPSPSSRPSPQRAQGHITRQILESLGVDARSTGGKDSKVFVCGPPPMEDALADKKGGGILTDLGYTKQQIHKF